MRGERVVHLSEKGMRLDRFLRIHFGTVPHRALATAMKAGRLTVDGRAAGFGDVLAAGAVVRLDDGTRAPDGAAATAARARLAALVLHEDAGLLVLDKPAGLAVHGGTGIGESLDDLLAALADPASGERPVLVHRLDRETSGVLVAAKTRALAAALGKAFAGRHVEKRYVACVHGRPEPATGVIDLPLVKRAGRPGEGDRVGVAEAGEPGAQAALTRYAVLASTADGRASLVALEPETGRQHQLRVHLAAIGHPIVGDRVHARAADGRPLTPPAGFAARLHLHAAAIGFRDPRDRRDRRFEAAVPFRLPD